MKTMRDLVLACALCCGRAHAAPFTDRDLTRTLATSCARGKRCVIYVWSPHMSLSIRGLNELDRYARAHALAVVPLLDPNADRALAERIRKEQGWSASATRKLASDVLIRRGARVHYPSYSFAKGGRLRGPLVPGVRRPPELDRLTGRFF